MAICYVRCCTISFCTKIRWLELMLSWQVMGFFKTLNFYHWYSFNLQCYTASTTFRKELDLLSGKQNINKSYVLFTNFFLTSMQPQCAELWKIHVSIYIERICFHLKDSVQRNLLEMALSNFVLVTIIENLNFLHVQAWNSIMYYLFQIHYFQ